MPLYTRSVQLIMFLAAAIAIATLAVSCGGKNAFRYPVTLDDRPIVENRVTDTLPDEVVTDTVTSEPQLPPVETQAVRSPAPDTATTVPSEPDTPVVTKPAGPDEDTSTDYAGWLYGTSKQQESSTPLYYGQVDSEDSASAVDDAVWRLFALAEEYHSMGVLANREGSWEEAQFYFEKSIKILAGLDIETDSDSIPTPEATKYSTLLDNIISDYRLTLRSLGQLEGDVTPSVLLERFTDLEGRLEHDTLLVYGKREQEITYDLPVKMNDRVKSSIIYFQTVAREALTRYLSRTKKYERLLKEALDREGLPLDLVYLSLVESGYNPKAYSWARASGLWQFIASTGRLYGLRRDWWVDERRDPRKATNAAARFLKDLYEEFGDWELAMAAYNGGPGRIRQTIRKQSTTDFWEMKLRRQTMDYVPLIYAAAIIAKDPARYGFGDVVYEPELIWDEVTIDRCLDLKVVADAVGCTVEDLKDLNPELLRNYTPPDDRSYLLKLPPGSRERFLGAYASMPSPKETSWVQHRIRPGETVSSIAARYGVSQYAIKESNKLGRSSRIYAGKTLIVPVPLDREFSRTSRRSDREYAAEGSVYTVRSGDTMWDIARVFGTSVDALRRVNYIERGSRIYVGQRLRIPSSATNLKELSQPSSSRAYASTDDPTPPVATAKRSSDAGRTHTVRSGNTLWEIARMYGTTTAELRRLNNMKPTSRIYPGQVLKVSGSGSGGFVLHTVKRGESLARIARQYGTSIARILSVNDLDDPDNLQVGQMLKIRLQ
jgi:membrane-bound lytic murein transglycosylase D